MKNIIIIGASSDIGKYMAMRFLKDGDRVIGTYRNQHEVRSLIGRKSLSLYHCDIMDNLSVDFFSGMFAHIGIKWDLLLFCIGALTPIGEFFKCDFDQWVESIHVNAIEQLRLLDSLYHYRSENASVIFFGGGHKDRPFVNYSAYWISKMMLNNMVQLLNSENNDLSVHIIETGWVRTKIHDQTLANPEGAGDNYEKTVNFLKDGVGTSMDEIYDRIKEAYGKQTNPG